MVKMITKFKFIRKKSEILNVGHGLMQYYPLLSPYAAIQLNRLKKENSPFLHRP